MASNGACPELETGVTENLGASMPVFTALSFATPAPGPADGPPLVTAVVPPGGPPVLSAFPRTPLVAGHDGQGLNWAGASNVLVQMKTEVGPVKAPQAQALALPQDPLVWRAPGAVCEGVACPPPRPLAAAPVVPAMAAHIIGVTQACDGGWFQGLPPPAPPPAPQPGPIVAPGNACPLSQGAHGEGSLAPSQAKTPPDDSCNTQSVYENFRLWQHYKPLARRHLPQSPNTEALSCFFIPVLRSLAQQKPTMTIEEGLWWAVREWKHTSNFDRMIYYEMAGKFLEFEAEEMQIQKSQWMKGPQCLPPPALPRLEPQGPSAPEVVKQPVYLPSKAGPKAPPACLPPPRPQRPAETKAPEEIPPEVVQQYMDIMEKLLGPPAGATREIEGQWEEGEVEQEGDGMLLDPGVLSYADNLCSQKDFVTKVEAVIHPRFLEELLSPDPHMDFLALSQELEQEEGLTLAQVAEKRLLSLKEEPCERAVPSHGTTQLDSISSKSAAGQGAERDVPGPQQGVSMETCPPQTAAWDAQGQGRVRTGMVRSINPVAVLERLDSRWLRAARPDSPPQDHRLTCPGVGTKDTWGLPGASPVKESRRLSEWSSEEEREIPGIVSAMGTNYRLRPWKLSQSPVPASGLLSLEGWEPQGALQSQSAKRRDLSPASAPATKSKKRALFRGPSPVQMPHLRPGLSACGAQSLAWGLSGPSQSKKRKGDPLLSKRKRMQHCSQ
ncbi:NUT family member 2G-like isoform X1 [Aotus nancymaae]|uniref:NUT family member 2G-like isoform X1 n=1 Tax=Aotus nancymaae TaxID=37293 RepID=UPI0030FE89E9